MNECLVWTGTANIICAKATTEGGERENKKEEGGGRKMTLFLSEDNAS